MQIIQEFAIDYGSPATPSGLTLGSGSPYVIHSLVISEESFTEATVNITVDFASGVSSTEVPFVSGVQILFDVFRTPEQTLVLRQAGTTRRDFDGFTGFDAQPTIRKANDPMNTGRSGRFEIAIRVGLPADKVGRLGRRNATIDVAFTGARVSRVTFAGTYTAVPASTDARNNYNGVIDAFTTSFLSTLTGTFKLAEEPQTTGNDTDKTLDFTRVFEQIIHSTAGAADPDIRNEVLIIGRMKQGPGDTPGQGAERLVRLGVTYSMSVDSETTTDVIGKWDSIRPSIISTAEQILNGGFVVVESEDPQVGITGNTLTATMVLLGVGTGGVIAYTATFGRTTIDPNVFTGLWTGNPLDHHRYTGIEDTRFRLVETYETLGALLNTPFNPTGTFRISDDENVNPLQVGLSDSSQFIKLVVTRTRVRRRINIVPIAVARATQVEAGGGGGGGGSEGGGEGGQGGQQQVQQQVIQLGIGGTNLGGSSGFSGGVFINPPVAP